MARLVLALVFVGILLAALATVALMFRAAWARAGSAAPLDTAAKGMLPKLSYALLIALILYVSFRGGR